MSNPSKTSGTADSMLGSAKETIGNMMGNNSMQAEGTAQKAGGQAEKETAKAQGHAEGTKDSMFGSLKENVGSVLGNNQMQAEGTANKAKGEAQKSANS